MKQKMILLFIFIGLCGIAYYTYEVISWKMDVDNNEGILNEIEDNVKIIDDNLENTSKYQIDFLKLKEENADTIAYLFVSGTNINYPVVKSGDNDYYLNHNFKKERNVAGWIFADYHNMFDGTDRNIIIYGHNTSDGSMFGTLKNTLKSTWYENVDNLEITLVSEKETSIYSPFSMYSIIPEDYYINTSFTTEDEYETFLKTIKSRSIYDFNVDLDKDDQILTLSSCIESGTKRIVLHARKVNSIKNN